MVTLSFGIFVFHYQSSELTEFILSLGSNIPSKIVLLL
jgi:hypothetical protein